MKKYLSVLMLVSAIVLSACSTNDSFDSILAKSNQSEIGQDYAVGTGSGCIVPLDSTCVRKKVQTRAYNDNDVSEELSQLDEVLYTYKLQEIHQTYNFLVPLAKVKSFHLQHLMKKMKVYSFI